MEFEGTCVSGLNILSERAETLGLLCYELGTVSTVCKSFVFTAKRTGLGRDVSPIFFFLFYSST